MKSKYTIFKDMENKQLVIKEYAELDKDVLTFVCEEVYPDNMIRSAISEGSKKLIAVLRTINFFPSSMYAQGLAEAIMELYRTNSADPVEINYNDSDFLPKTRSKRVSEDDIEVEEEDIEEEIDEDFDEKFEEEPDIKKINSSLSLADEDDYDDLDDEK